MAKRAVSVFMVICLAVAIFVCQREINRRAKTSEELVEELMYFPSGKFITQVSSGYEHVFADFVWLRFVQYYGRHLMTDLEFKYLEHILDILTTLDPQFTVAYTFGALLLVTNVNDPQAAFTLLDKGIRANPLKWHLPYMKGFIYYVYLQKFSLAGKFFKIAAHLPDAPDGVRRFAAFMYQRAGSVDISLYLWWELYLSTKNVYEQEVAVRNIKKNTVEKLERILYDYREEKGSLPLSLEALVNEGYLKSVPVAPDGGEYFIDHEKRIVDCSTGGYLRSDWREHL